MATQNTPSSHPALMRYSDAVRGWFLDAFKEPTPVQEQAWEAIENGENALVIAPTGSGKTLAAFLFAIDRLMREKAAGALLPKGERPAKGVRVLYVSPLKALGADVDRNLQVPLAGIAERLAARGDSALDVRSGMRTGDTTPDQRRGLVRNPPDILITTPESLYLMLTSQAREILRTVETVIVDEVHALAGGKRGTHLAVSLERLDDLLERPAQRIGLSATVRPHEEVARFLGGPHPVRVIAAEGRPNLDVDVVVPARDMTSIPAYPGVDAAASNLGARGARSRRAPAEQAWKSDRALRTMMAGGKPASSATPDSRSGSSSIWPLIEASLLDEIVAHRTIIVFVNSRGLCEKLTARLNELYAKREGLLVSDGAAGEGAPSHIRSDLGSTSELSQGADQVIAKAHHGSVSKEKRLQVEQELKNGELRCVVATSSLELGIDMGSIDLVLQVAAPPSVASALQRIGRANHQVGGRSEGAIYPRTRTEIIDAAVIAEGMRTGSIEATALVCNPLDVLAQQTVAAVAMGGVTADGWYETVRRAAPFAQLSRRMFDSVLDMLSGRYASADLAEFAPRIVWDRESGVLTPRPSAQRLAVTAAGTIPDRGMFSVVLPEGGGNEGRRRVGELDEEMVYESRVGDIIALGTSSWRISEITRDRVIVEPAPGRSARLPFWHGEGIGRPAETGRARGAFLRAVVEGLIDEPGEGRAERPRIEPALQRRLDEDGLDADAQRNLLGLVRDQREATGVVPNDKTLVVERCEDETGDWRVMLHSPYGRRVHEPWAMAVSDRVKATLGYDPQVGASDDGILLRIPMTETRLPGAELFVFDPDELDRIVRDRVDATALFAARFRECAARALLMSPTQPGKRAPLWQQRLKAGQLLEAARGERDFPIMLETVRECLQDVYDMPALHDLMEGVQAGSVRVVETQTSVPSPFAGPLLFGYVGEHLYEGDLPHAERRASLLSLDPSLLGELLGTTDMAELLDPKVMCEVEEALQRTAEDRQARGVEGVADLLRVLGPLSVDEVTQRLESGEAIAALEELERTKRAFPAMIGGSERWATVEEAGRLREALGVEIPSWVPATFLEVRAQDDGEALLDDFVVRYARTHGPFSTDAVAARLGVGPALARESLRRLTARGGVVRGRFGCAAGESVEREWVSSEVFRRLRALSLAKARKAVQAVPTAAYVRYLLDAQGIGSSGSGRLEGVDGVAQVLAQFEGVALPAASWEAHVLPSRVRDYRPSMLDELIASGDVVWVGDRREDDRAGGSSPRPRGVSPVGLVAFYPTDSPLAPVSVDGADAFESTVLPSVERAVADALSAGGGLFFRQLADAVRRQLAPERVDEASIAAALLELVWSGRATNDTFAPVRAAEAGGATGHAPAPVRRRVSSRRGRSFAPERASVAASTTVSAALSGRWSLLAPSRENDTVRAVALVESVLDRYGVLTRDAVLLSGVPGGMDTLMPVLRSMEDAGEVLRGAFVEGLGPAQFAARATVDVLRTYAGDQVSAETVVFAADDPACLFGAGIPWPSVAGGSVNEDEAHLLRPSRRSGSLVVVCEGEAVLYAAPGLRSVLSFTLDNEVLRDAVGALIAQVSRTLKRQGGDGARKKIVVETFNGQPVLSTPLADYLHDAGLVRLPDGMRLYIDPFA